MAPMTNPVTAAAIGPAPLVLLQQFFAQANTLGGHFHQLILLDEFQRLFQGVAHGRCQGQRLVGTGCPDVGELLALGGIDRKIVIAAVQADDLALVHVHIGLDEHTPPVLQVEY